MRKLLPLASLILLGSFELSAQELSKLPWREIGPSSFGGRIDDIEAVPGRPSTIFVGTAGGGVYRTHNRGTTWTAVFDRDGTSTSIGDIAIAPSDPNIVWVGTGEANNRQSSTWGDGVYRSLDGGNTWVHMGLKDSQNIGRVVIHPRDPSTVFVAAVGHLWGPNAERGLYRTKDAGKTWQKVLAGNDVTGAIDVAMDPDGRTLYAALYQRQRKPFGFVGGGPGSGLHRSLDGGDTWEKLTNGLPTGTMGRIGIAIAPSQPATVYAIVEARGTGGVYRSDDRGTTWRRTNSINPRPMYYSNVRVDPQHPDKVWVVASSLHLSTDGGKTFTTDNTGDRVHVDHHALWLNPADGDHMLLGNDGGFYISYDGAKNWDFVDNLPIGQFYDIDVDDRDPYYVYGGTQDNGTWGVPVRTHNLTGITNADVINLAYGDGFYTVTDPSDPKYIYANSQNGRAYRVHIGSKEERGIRPVSADAKDTLRWNWSTPMHRSPHDPKTVYYGAQKLFRTRDAGQTWVAISGDLSRNIAWEKLPIMGVVRDSTTLSRNDGVGEYGTLTTISESPKTAGTILVGTDDGNVQLTTDAGRTSNITSRFRLPAPRWVSRVLWSTHDARVAYVTFDGHADDDMAPYVFRTADAGATWTPIAGDLPAGNSVKTVEEHPGNPAVLFAGTEFGLYITFNGGRAWQHAGGNLPRVRIDDIAVHPRTRDLVLGTHGRSIIVLDDISLFDAGAPTVAAGEAALYPIRASRQRFVARMLPTPGARAFQAPNPPEGAILTYALGSGAANDTVARFTVTSPSGDVVRSFTGPGRAGLHRVAWDLRYDRAPGVTDADEGWFGLPYGSWVLPGRYTVTLDARGRKVTRTVEVLGEDRVEVAATAAADRHAAERRLATLIGSFNDGVQLWQKMTGERRRVEDALKDQAAKRDSLAPLMKRLGLQLDSLGARFRPGFGGPKFGFLDLDGSLQASSTGPTEAQQRTIDQLAAQLRRDLTALNALLAGDFATFQRQASGVVGVLRPVDIP